MADDKDLYLPETQNRAPDAPSILIITADKCEDLEFFYPYYRFIEAGYRVDVATPDGGSFKGKQGLELKSSRKLEDIDPEIYKLLYLPGGKAPATLKKNDKALEVAKFFAKNGKLISAICHGPQILAAADVIRGRRIAGWPEIKDEITEAGAEYADEETVLDGPFITARMPGDLPSHVRQTLETFAEYLQSSKKAVSSAA